MATFTKTEKLIACAIRRDGVLHVGSKAGHWEIRERLGDADPRQRRLGDDEGFVTNNNLRFVDRDEAKEIGIEAGQCRPQQRELLSSDIDW